MKNKKKADKEILDLVRPMVSEGIDHCLPIHNRIEENSKYVRGEQWSKADADRQEQRERPSVPWNSVFKVTHAICNREIVERLVPKVMGREKSDFGVANVLDEVCRWQRQNSFSEHHESLAFRSAGIGGYGCMHKFWNPVANNGDGQIQDEEVYIGEMLWPSKSRATNLTDRRWHVRGRWCDADYADSLWGGESEALRAKINGVKRGKYGKSSYSSPQSADKLPVQSSGGNITGTWESVKAGNWIRSYTKEVFVVEAEWMETKITYRVAYPRRMYEWIEFKAGVAPLIVDTDQGPVELPLEMYETFTDQEQAELELSIINDIEIKKFDSFAGVQEIKDDYFQAFGGTFEDYVKTGREVVNYAVITDDVVISSGVRKWGWSYYFLTGFPFETSEGMEHYGVVDIIKGPQDYKNKLISSLVSMYMASPKGTMIIEKTAVPNFQEFADRFASPTGVVQVPDGFIQQERYKFAEPPRYPPIVDALLSLADRGVEDGLGLSSIDLGTQNDLRRISGPAIQAASTAKNVIVAHLFDALRMFRKQYGMCNIRFITTQYRPEEIVRIIGTDKIEDMQTIPPDWSDIFRFDVVIDEQPTSPSESAEQLDYLTRTGTLERWEAEGKIQFEDALDMLPYIPESLKRKIIKNRDIRSQLDQCVALVNAFQEVLSGTENGGEIISAAQQLSQEMLTQPAEGATS